MIEDGLEAVVAGESTGGGELGVPPGSAQRPGNENRDEGEASAGSLLQGWDKAGRLELGDRRESEDRRPIPWPGGGSLEEKICVICWKWVP